MKRALFLTTLVCICNAAFAEPVDRTAAEAFAKKYFRSTDVDLVWDGTPAATKAGAEDPALYVFNNPGGGWVVVAGDDCAVPVLAHGTGEFDATDMPDNMAAWLQHVADNIKAASSAGVGQTEEVKEKWKSAPDSRKMDGGQVLLQTAAWGQDAPYNNSCPVYNGGHCIVGCVATAMAIVLRYNGWPHYGTGTIPQYTSHNNSRIAVPAVNIDGYEYNWNNMPLTDARKDSTWTDAQKAAVADLMFHCGAMVKMGYEGPDVGSGADSYDIVQALSTYMSYSKHAMERYRSSYSNEEWFGMLKAELDADRPVIYGGYGPQRGGHQFVCDGYNSNKEVHINWGWGAKYNYGWYAVCYLGDLDNDPDRIENVYSRDDSAIFGLCPAESGESYRVKELFLMADSTYNGITLRSGTIAKNSTFRLDAGAVSNHDFLSNYSGGTAKFALVDKDGSVKEYISNDVSLSVNKASGSTFRKTYLNNIECTITSDLELGDCIKLYYRNDGIWWPMSADTQYRSSAPTVGALGVFDVTMINADQNLAAGQQFYPSLTFGQKVPSSIVWYYDGSRLLPDHSKLTNCYHVVLTSGSHIIKARITYTDNSTETIERELIVE